MSKMKRFIYFSIIFILALALLEAMSYLTIAQLYKKRPPDFSVVYKNSLPGNGTFLLDSSEYQQEFVPFPYFGYSHNLSLPFLNNYGFLSPYSYPYEKKQNQFTLAILGGSVAEGFAAWLHTQASARPELAKAILESFQQKNKELIILNMAMGAMKQPQQFIIFSYFLESIDASINLDGYNEMFINNGSLDVLPSDFPAFSSYMYFQTEKSNEIKHSIFSKRRKQLFITKLPLKNSLLGRSSLYFLLWKPLYSLLESSINKNFDLPKNLENEMFNLHKTILKKYQPDTFPKKNLAIWKKYSTLQSLIANQNKIPAFFFLQPNQFVKNSKIFSSEEREIAFKGITQELLTLYQKKNTLLQTGVKDLQRANINSYDLSYVFKNDDRILYTDNMCHFNKNGYELVLQEMLNLIKRNYQ